MLRELSGYLIDPLFLLFLFWLIAWLISFFKKANIPLRVGVIVLFYFLSTPWASSFFLTSLESYPPIDFHKEHWKFAKRDAIVVLAGSAGYSAIYGHYEIGDSTLRRLLYGAYLHKQLEMPMVLSGGTLPWLKNHSIAQIMDQFLWYHEGFYARYLENKSKTTDENAQYTYAILGPLKKTRIILVTDVWHMKRSVMAFEHYGFNVLAAPVGYHHANIDEGIKQYLPSHKSFNAIYNYLHETFGMVYYYLHYKYGFSNKKEFT